MKDEQRIECLKDKRVQLKEKIKAEANRPLPDALGLMRMKRERLALKEEIRALERRSTAASAA